MTTEWTWMEEAAITGLVSGFMLEFYRHHIAQQTGPCDVRERARDSRWRIYIRDLHVSPFMYVTCQFHQEALGSITIHRTRGGMSWLWHVEHHPDDFVRFYGELRREIRRFMARHKMSPSASVAFASLMDRPLD